MTTCTRSTAISSVISSAVTERGKNALVLYPLGGLGEGNVGPLHTVRGTVFPTPRQRTASSALLLSPERPENHASGLDRIAWCIYTYLYKAEIIFGNLRKEL